MSALKSLSALKGINARLLNSQEKSAQCVRDSLPIVIEPQKNFDSTELHSLVRTESNLFKDALHEAGALLYRGFNIEKDEDFEQLLLSLRPEYPLQSYFLSELGRDRIEGCEYVFHTNSRVKSGGTIWFGGFHSENFYNPDVPSFMSFFCKVPSTLGGETGLIYTPDVYARLPESLKTKMKEKAVLTRTISLETIAKRYQITEEMFETFAQANGLAIEIKKGKKYLYLYKPVLFQHPSTGRIGFQVNLSLEGQVAERLLRHSVEKTYPWDQWFKHRLFWRIMDVMSYAVENTLSSDWFRNHNFGKQSKDSFLAERLTKAEWKIVGEAMRDNLTTFTWQKGDVLVFDNLQMLHAGMPGSGERSLSVILCDPIPMDFTNRSGIIAPTGKIRPYLTIADRLEQFIQDHKEFTSQTS